MKKIWIFDQKTSVIEFHFFAGKLKITPSDYPWVNN